MIHLTCMQPKHASPARALLCTQAKINNKQRTLTMLQMTKDSEPASTIL